MVGELKMVGEEVNLWELYKFLKKTRFMEGKELDVVLAPLGMLLLLVYHLWLMFTIKRNPRRTVIGLNAESRRLWVSCMMAVSIHSHLITCFFFFVFGEDGMGSNSDCVLLFIPNCNNWGFVFRTVMTRSGTDNNV